MDGNRLRWNDMIVNMSLELFFRTRNNIKNAGGNLDAGWYTEDENGFVLVMQLNSYFIKTVVTLDDLKKLEKPEFNTLVANKPIFFENMDLSRDDFRKKYLNDFVKVISFE